MRGTDDDDIMNYRFSPNRPFAPSCLRAFVIVHALAATGILATISSPMSAVHDEIVASPRGATREIRRLSSLIEISQALAGTLNLTAALPQALDVLERHHQVVRSAVTLLDEDSRELAIRASTGLTADGQRARYRLGEGITGRVVDTGKPVVVPQVSKEPLLLNRAARRDRQELTFICVPLVVNRRPVGRPGRGPALQEGPRLRPVVEVLQAGGGHHRAGGEGEPHGRGRAQAPGGREHPPARRAARSLCLPAPGGHQRAHPAGVRAGGAGGADQHHGADPRRVGHRQGDDRARDPLQLGPGQEAVHQGQLRGAARVADRIRAVRLRAGRVHRRAEPEEGALRAGRRRHDLPRRDRRSRAWPRR